MSRSKPERLTERKQSQNQSGDKRAELIMSIIRLLNLADEEKLRNIYHFALHLI